MEYFYRNDEEFGFASFADLFAAAEPGDELLECLRNDCRTLVVKKKTKTQLTLSQPGCADIRVSRDGYIFGSDDGYLRKYIRTSDKMRQLRIKLDIFNFTVEKAVNDEQITEIAQILGISA